MSETPPKLFISYSWSSPEHKAWVLELARQLAESGVHPILDEWDLKPGDDAYLFMERMVTDETITKVILICDRVYAKKANARAGGVGTETQIISPDLYSREKQSKFVAVLSETDDDGKPFVPAYYRSKIHIDLSSEISYTENFETLVRWIHDKPLHLRPAIGPRPAYLDDDPAGIRLGTSSALRRCLDAIQNSKPHAIPALRDYFDLLATELEKFRLPQANPSDGSPFDDHVISNIKDFLPYRNEIVGLFVVIAKYREDAETRQVVHKFFESILRYSRRPATVMQYSEWDWDNFRFIIHELLLYYVAVLIKFEKFDSVGAFLDELFLVGQHPDTGLAEMLPFTVFCFEFGSLRYRAQRLKKEEAGLHANLLRERCEGTGLEFSQLMAADVIMFLRFQLGRTQGGIWWPSTVGHLRYNRESLEPFARACSKKYFERIKNAIGILDKSDLEQCVIKIESDQRGFHHALFSRVSLRGLIQLEDLATRP